MSGGRARPRLTLLQLLFIVAAVAVVAWTISFFRNVLEAWKTADTSAQPRQMVLSLKMYATEQHGDIFPPLDPRPGHLMFDSQGVYPAYLRTPWLFASPTDEKSVKLLKTMDESDVEGSRQYIGDQSYIYLGYMLTTEAEGLAFVDAYRRQAELGAGFDADLPVASGRGSAGTDTLYRFRSHQIDIEAFLTEHGAPKPVAASRIPVIIERPGHHRHNPGGWVAFLDGRCELITYPGKFPMTKKFIEALESLDALEP